MEKFEKISKKTFSQLIVDQIQKRILAGELDPGDKLPSERALAEMFSVSRATVREALRALQYMGILDIRLNDGAYLSDRINLLSDHFRTSYLLKQFTLMELLEARQFMEVAVASLAAKRATPEHIARLKRIYSRELECRDDMDSFSEADVAFHFTLTEACQNSFFLNMIKPVRQLLKETNIDQYKKPNQAYITAEYHGRILAAIIKGDIAEAEKVMKEHMDNIVTTTSEIYQKELSENSTGEEQRIP